MFLLSPMFPTTNKLRLLSFACTFLFLAWGCQPGQRRESKGEEGKPLSSVTISHAKGFQIDHFSHYTKVILRNPWSNDNKPYAVYYLYRNDSTLLPADGIKVKIPLDSLAVNTFSYFTFLYLLNEGDAITGVTDGFRIYHPDILRKLDAGKITDLGDPFHPNVEKPCAEAAGCHQLGICTT